MLKYKVKLNEPKGYNELKIKELYLSPDLSFISGITDYSYGLIDGQHISIEFNNDNRFHDAIVNIENVIRKGYVILEQEFKVEECNGEKLYRYVDGKYYFTSDNDTTRVNVTYWVENNKIVIGENSYDVDLQLDKNGNEIYKHFIQIKGDKKLPINNCGKENWEHITKFYIRKNNDYELKIDDLSCANKYPYFIYNIDKTLSINDKSKLFDYYNTKIYLTFDKTDGKYKATLPNDKVFIQNNSKVKCNDEIYDLEYEWRNTNNGEFLHIFLNQPQYNFTTGQKILVESITTITTKCDVYTTQETPTEDTIEGYILYCGKKYNISDDTIDFINIQDKEYELTYTDDDHGYIELNGNVIYLSISGLTATKLRQHKLVNETSYNIKKYKYVDIDNIKYLVKTYYKDNEQNINIFSVNIIKKEVFTLNIVDVINNSMLRCSPDVGEDGEKSGICSIISSNHRNMIFKLQNPLFNESNVDINSFIEAKNRGEEEIFDSIKIFNPSNYITLPLTLKNDIQVNINQEDILENIFFKKEKENSINPYIDMERDIYYPCFCVNEDNKNFSLINEIQFDLHFRSRNLEDWKINEDIFEGGEKTIKCDWNIFDNYSDYDTSSTTSVVKPKIEKIENLKYYQPSDLLYFLNFTDDDVFYQKSKISKSFLRLLFFDDIDVANQTLLYSCTVFMNENKLYKTYIDEINKQDNMYVSVSEEQNKEEVLTSNTISVYNDTCNDKDEVTFDENKRLAAKFIVKNRYESEESAEGFYLHIFKDYSEKLHDKTIYMKVEFNHAGEGRTINMMMPFTYIDNKPQLMELLPGTSDLNTLKEGYPLKQLYEHMFIPIKVVYDEYNKKYVYYLPDGLVKHEEKGVMKFNLYEIKIKDESNDESDT